MIYQKRLIIDLNKLSIVKIGLIFDPITNKFNTVTPYILTLSVHHIILKLSFIYILICPIKHSFTTFLSLIILSNVFRAVCPRFFSKSMLHTTKPVSFIEISLNWIKRALSMILIFDLISLVIVSTIFNHESFSLELTVLPKALFEVFVMGKHSTITVFKTLVSLTLVDITILKLINWCFRKLKLPGFILGYTPNFLHNLFYIGDLYNRKSLELLL